MKIDFLVADNQYDSTLTFAKGFVKALERQGVEARIIWAGEYQFSKALYEISANSPDLTCSFSDITGWDGQNLGELLQIPHLSILVDPVVYFLHQLKGEYSWVSCVDEEEAQLLKEEFAFERSFFLPHGVDRALLDLPEKERLYDVVFFGTCVDLDVVEESWKELYPVRTQKLLKEVSERVLSPEGISTLKALIEAGVKEDEMVVMHSEVDLYTREKNRIELLRAVKGRSVDVWGDGPWEKYGLNAKIHPAIHFDQTVEIMRQSRVVLNSSPRFMHGSHERIFHALACGCQVVTGDNSFVRKHFKSSDGVWTYRYGEWEDFPDLPEQKVRREAVLPHTWDARATTLLENTRSLCCRPGIGGSS